MSSEEKTTARAFATVIVCRRDCCRRLELTKAGITPTIVIPTKKCCYWCFLLELMLLWIVKELVCKSLTYPVAAVVYSVLHHQSDYLSIEVFKYSSIFWSHFLKLVLIIFFPPLPRPSCSPAVGSSVPPGMTSLSPDQHVLPFCCTTT